MPCRKWRRTSIRKLLPKLEEWLMVNFPTPYPVRARYYKKEPVVEGEKCSGYCRRVGQKIEIAIHLANGREMMIDTLIHEWAHATNMRQASLDRLIEVDHPPEWGITYAAIITKLFDEDRTSEVVE